MSWEPPHILTIFFLLYFRIYMSFRKNLNSVIYCVIAMNLAPRSIQHFFLKKLYEYLRIGEPSHIIAQFFHDYFYIYILFQNLLNSHILVCYNSWIQRPQHQIFLSKNFISTSVMSWGNTTYTHTIFSHSFPQIHFLFLKKITQIFSLFVCYCA